MMNGYLNNGMESRFTFVCCCCPTRYSSV